MLAKPESVAEYFEILALDSPTQFSFLLAGSIEIWERAASDATLVLGLADLADEVKAAAIERGVIQLAFDTWAWWGRFAALCAHRTTAAAIRKGNDN